MLFKIAISIIFHEKEKYIGAMAGVALAIFLVILQTGFYLGFRRDITNIIDSFDSDIWIVPKNRPSFDIWDSMDDLGYWKALRHPDVDKVARIVWAFAIWRNPEDGEKQFVQVLGVDFDAGIPIDLGISSEQLAPLLRGEGHVLICERDRKKLGITRDRQEGAEIYGKRVVVVGYLQKFIHLFTTSYLVVTDLGNAKTLVRFPPSNISYVVIKCRLEADVAKVIKDLKRVMPEHSVYSTDDFRSISATYWESGAGIGPILLVSALLGALVGILIVMLTFYISTVEKISVFASMKALGASNGEIITILVIQVIIVYIIGSTMAGIWLYFALAAFAKTTISVVVTFWLIVSALGAMALCSGFGCLLPILKLVNTDPGEAFRT